MLITHVSFQKKDATESKTSKRRQEGEENCMSRHSQRFERKLKKRRPTPERKDSGAKPKWKEKKQREKRNVGSVKGQKIYLNGRAE